MASIFRWTGDANAGEGRPPDGRSISRASAIANHRRQVTGSPSAGSPLPISNRDSHGRLRVPPFQATAATSYSDSEPYILYLRFFMLIYILDFVSISPFSYSQPIDEITTVSERTESVDPLLERVRALKIVGLLFLRTRFSFLFFLKTQSYSYSCWFWLLQTPPLLNSPPPTESSLSDILVRKPSSSSSAPISGDLCFFPLLRLDIIFYPLCLFTVEERLQLWLDCMVCWTLLTMLRTRDFVF